MSWGAIAAVAAPIVGGLVGNVMSQGDRNKARSAMKQAMAELEAVGYPPDLSKEIIYKQFEQVGILTPELEEDIQMVASEFTNLKEDPTARNNQLEAINRFKQQMETGFGAEERAAQNQIMSEMNQAQKAKQEQILADQARRGMSGSGNAMVAQLISSQEGTNRASTAGNELAGMIAQRIRQGTQDMSGAAQNLRQQDYTVDSDRARALDTRNQYLHANSVGRQQRNVSSINDINRMNLGQKQNTADSNTNLYNQEQRRQSDAEGNYWRDKMDYAKAKANALSGQQQYYENRAKETANTYTGLGNSAGQGVSAYNKK